jgi:Fe-S oxidoreductase
MARLVFAPGCALLLYKPRLAEKLHARLNGLFGALDLFSSCCHHAPAPPSGAEVVTVCPGCDRRYRQNYARSLSLPLWEVLLGDGSFPFPDYGGAEMTVLDACPTRDQPRVHDAVRGLAARMNIALVEPGRTRERATCCGDSFYGALSAEGVIGQMKAKGEEMPPQDILVYCVSCAKSMFIAGRRPRYLVDLLSGEETAPGTLHPDEWHRELDAFIESQICPK